MLQLKNISYNIGKAKILYDISLSFAENKFNVILGPNGAGKSTLLKLATGVITPSSGFVNIAGENIDKFSARQLSTQRAVLSQQVDMAFPLTVREVVLMGRYPHFNNVPSLLDKKIIKSALEQVSIAHKSEQLYTTLSGGEKQKVQMARVLAQIWQLSDSKEQKYLFLDEPTTSLDIRYQLQILDLAQSLLQQNITVIAILHDLNLSFQYGENFFFLKNGKLVYETAYKNAISEKLIEKIYEVKAKKYFNEAHQQSSWKFEL